MAEPVDIDLRSVTIRYGDGPPVVRDVDLHIPAGTTTALLGPSGCGKTTLLRSIAGLERPSSGSISIGQQQVSGDSTWVAPERRHVGMVFQDAALFPHLSVADNVAFGLRRTADAGARRRRVAEMLELVGLESLADRSPATLSGGQRQRVALARSLAPQPAVLLLDEPFSALDAALRNHLRADVSRIIREVGVTTVFVTHDQTEAFLVGDRIGVMHDGSMRQFGSAAEIYGTPADRWVATFVGEANFVPGHATDGVAETALGPIALTDRALRGDVVVMARPEELLLDGSAGSDTGQPAALVTAVEYLGADASVVVTSADGDEWRIRVTPAASPTIGSAVRVRHRGTTAPAWPA